MTAIQIETQYSTGASRRAIEQALVAAGKDLGHLRVTRHGGRNPYRSPKSRAARAGLPAIGPPGWGG